MGVIGEVFPMDAGVRLEWNLGRGVKIRVAGKTGGMELFIHMRIGCLRKRLLVKGRESDLEMVRHVDGDLGDLGRVTDVSETSGLKTTWCTGDQRDRRPIPREGFGEGISE